MVRLGAVVQTVRNGRGIALMEMERAGKCKFYVLGTDWIIPPSSSLSLSIPFSVLIAVNNDTASRLGSLRILLVRQPSLLGPTLDCHPQIGESPLAIFNQKRETLIELFV